MAGEYSCRCVNPDTHEEKMSDVKIFVECKCSFVLVLFPVYMYWRNKLLVYKKLIEKNNKNNNKQPKSNNKLTRYSNNETNKNRGKQPKQKKQQRKTITAHIRSN